MYNEELVGNEGNDMAKYDRRRNEKRVFEISLSKINPQTDRQGDSEDGLILKVVCLQSVVKSRL